VNSKLKFVIYLFTYIRRYRLHQNIFIFIWTFLDLLSFRIIFNGLLGFFRFKFILKPGIFVSSIRLI